MECPLAPALSPTPLEMHPSSLFLLPPPFSANRAHQVVRPTGIAISNDLRPGFSLAPRGTSGERVRERGWSAVSVPPLRLSQKFQKAEFPQIFLPQLSCGAF